MAAVLLSLALLAGPAQAHGDHWRTSTSTTKWTCITHYESTHREHIDDGKFQIINQTWGAYGGYKFASDAGNATMKQQRIVRNRIWKYGYGDSGPQGLNAWSAWRNNCR